ncbi:MAG: MmgE/PrpD family protein [Thermodesulfobacteriota bacterium]|nr:MmgE/PrpD family protein [Thermodesulfobacteriota bacterium]
MMENVTERLAHAVTNIGFDDLPQDVIKGIKWILLDSIGCALGGSQTDKARMSLELINELGGNPQASIIGGPYTSYALAAFVNAELINALDYDYIGPLVGHVCPYVTPPCLSIGERQNASGKDLIVALAVGHEVGGRMVNSLVQANMPKDEPPYYEESLRYSYSHSVFGGVAGAGKLLGFDAEKMRNAFGIAGMSTAVPASMKWSHTGGPAIMLKYGAWPGWISQLATTAALVAEKGFTGDTTVLDGKWGYWQMVGSPFFKVDNLLKGLGEVWHATRGEYKPYPCCRCNHAGIDGICNLMQQHGIKPGDIEEIVVKGDSWLQQPHRMGRELKSPLDIQFANMYIFGLAPYFGLIPSPAWGTSEVYDLPEIKAMSEKVKIELHPQTDEIIAGKVKAGQKPGFRKTIVEIKAKGRKFVTEVEGPRGDPDNPLSESELLEKFRHNASYSFLEKEKAEKIIEAILNLDELDSVKELGKLWSVKHLR